MKLNYMGLRFHCVEQQKEADSLVGRSASCRHRRPLEASPQKLAAETKGTKGKNQ